MATVASRSAMNVSSQSRPVLGPHHSQADGDDVGGGDDDQ
jgi:hypothetical protein